MLGSLIDVNVWVAATFEAHPFTLVARKVINDHNSDNPAVFCRATQHGFLRLASNPVLLKQYGVPTLTNRDALAALNGFMANPKIRERSEAPGTIRLWHEFAARETASPQLWMDAYLAAFAISANLQLITFDTDFKSFERRGLRVSLLS